MLSQEEYTIRRVEASDYELGALESLKTLTTVGEISKQEFTNLINQWDTLKLSNGTHHIYNTLVIIEKQTNRVVAIGSIFIEEKLIHKCGLVGHIEDISVLGNQQGKQLGKNLITELIKVGKDSGAYKIILDCDEKNVGFYEKCGLNRAGVEMSIRFDK
jgi:glucosamine-phosphate N-acetyltransferase